MSQGKRLAAPRPEKTASLGEISMDKLYQIDGKNTTASSRKKSASKKHTEPQTTRNSRHSDAHNSTNGNLKKAAIAYAEAGLKIIPLNGKIPAIKGGHGYLDASRNINQIKEWWSKYPNANIGLACGENSITVLDFDPRNGSDKTKEKLINERGPLPKTSRQTTPRGGEHLVFRNDDGVIYKSPGKGVDVITNGYIVVAPSETKNGTYDWTIPLEFTRLAPVPGWLPITTPTDATVEDEGPLRDPPDICTQLRILVEQGADQDGAIIPVGERSEAFFKAVGWLKYSGFSESQVVTYMISHLNGIVAKYGSKRGEKEIRRAYAKCDAAESDQGIIEMFDDPPCKNLIQTSEEFVAGFTSPDYLVEGTIQCSYIYSLTAKTGHGKTAVLLLLSAKLATGDLFGGAVTKKGRVCYLAGENPDDIRARWLLASDVYQFDADSIDVHFIPGTYSIPEMFDRIKMEAEEVGGFKLIIVDTSAAFFQGEEENNNSQSGGYARDLRKLTTLPGEPGVIVACHPVKNPSKENLLPRGGGAFIAEVDGNLTLWSSSDKTTELHWCGKFRGPEFEPQSFKMEVRTTERVKDSKGKLMPSVVALPLTDNDTRIMIEEATSNENKVLMVLKEYSSASEADIARQLEWFNSNGEPLKSKVHRAKEKLKRWKLIVRKRNGWELTKEGQKEANKIKDAEVEFKDEMVGDDP
jgi:hypothetical protein